MVNFPKRSSQTSSLRTSKIVVEQFLQSINWSPFQPQYQPVHCLYSIHSYDAAGVFHLQHLDIAEPNHLGQPALEAFDIQQLEDELARRKRKMLFDVGNNEYAPIETAADLSVVDTPTVVTISSYERRATVKVEPTDESEFMVQKENDVEDEIEVKAGCEGEGAGRSGNSTRPRKRARKGPTPAPYIATVHSLAQTGTATVTSSNAVVNDDIMDRIKKCLARYNHPTTPEHEAKVAFRIASRLMEQHNISQAELAEQEGATGGMWRSGRSIVWLIRSDGDQSKKVKHFAYADRIGHAMRRFFDCKHYTVRTQRSLHFIFYGIAENTITAALAFEMAYNLISEWARAQEGVGPKNSYCLGASWQLQKMAKAEKAAEEARAIEAEKEALASKVRQEEMEHEERLARLQSTVEDDEGIVDEIGSDLQRDDGGPENIVNDGPVDDDTQSTKSWQSDETEFNGFGDDSGLKHEDEGVIEPDFVEDDELMDLNKDLDEEIQQYPQPEPASRSASPSTEPLPAHFSQQNLGNPAALEKTLPTLPTSPSEDNLD